MFNTPISARKLGTVGPPIAGVKVYIIGEDGQEVPIGEDGEICCSGHNIMRGYYKNPEATAEVITPGPEGQPMFHTGDMGRLDKDGYLKVTGRIKEQFKLENGKYVVPGPVEDVIALSRYVFQVVLHGANRPYNIALVVPEWEAVRHALGVDESVTEEDMAQDPKVAELIGTSVQDHCVGLKKFEIPQKIAIVSPFTAANNMLTPKLSIRRHKVLEAYEDVVNKLYGEEGNGN